MYEIANVEFLRVDRTWTVVFLSNQSDQAEGFKITGPIPDDAGVAGRVKVFSHVARELAHPTGTRAGRRMGRHLQLPIPDPARPRRRCMQSTACPCQQGMGGSRMKSKVLIIRRRTTLPGIPAYAAELGQINPIRPLFPVARQLAKFHRERHPRSRFSAPGGGHDLAGHPRWTTIHRCGQDARAAR
jgi:hypothetical protein